MSLRNSIKDTWDYIKQDIRSVGDRYFEIFARDPQTGTPYRYTVDEFVKIASFGNTVVVKSVEDLMDIDSTKNYMIDGAINTGSESIVIPEGGLSLGALNAARETSYLYSDEDNYTMFVSPSGGYSGNVYMNEGGFPKLTGTNSKLFDLNNDGNGSFEFQNVNFGGFLVNDGITSLGDLDGYRQYFFSGCGFYFVNDGFTLNNTSNGLVLQDSNVINPTTSMTLFKEGTNLLFEGSVRSNINFLSVNSASVLFDFQESNFENKGAFALNNVRTTASDAIPNITGASSYSRFRNCDGIKNTYVGGQWTISSATPTVISSISTPVKIAGTTTYIDLQWFTQTTDNEFVYDGDQTIEIEVKGNLSFSGTNGDVINLYVRQWDDSASTYIDLSETGGSTLNSSGRAEGVSFNAIGTVDNNDRIELWVENESAGRNVTALPDGYVILNERPS